MTWSVKIIHIDLKTVGDATIIIVRDTATPANDRNILIDGGMETCAQTIANELVDRDSAGPGARFNLAIVTHFDADHVRGIRELAGSGIETMRGTIYRDRGETRTVSVKVNDRNNPPDYYTYPTYGDRPESESYYQNTEAQRRSEIRDAVTDTIWNGVRASAGLPGVNLDFDGLDRGDRAAFARIGLDVAFLKEFSTLEVREAQTTRAYDIILGHAIEHSVGPDKAMLQALSRRSERKYLPNAAVQSVPLPNVRRAYDALRYDYGRHSLVGKEFIWGGTTPPGAPELTCVCENSYGLQADGTVRSVVLTADGSKKRDDLENVSSLGFVLQFNNFKYYIGGDLGVYQEQNITDPLIENIDVLKCSHHGSRNSTSSTFLRTTNPVVAVISNSDNNTHGHPDLDTQIRLNRNATDLVNYFMTGFPKAWIRSPKAKVMGNGGTLRGHVRIVIDEAGSALPNAQFTVEGYAADDGAWHQIHTDPHIGVARTTTWFTHTYQRGVPVATPGPAVDVTPIARWGLTITDPAATSGTSSGATSSTSTGRSRKNKGGGRVRAVSATKKARPASSVEYYSDDDLEPDDDFEVDDGVDEDF
jgi:beta-lactamase superfamily II metal-dependent hydrolase